jgi:hypothetical protein
MRATSPLHPKTTKHQVQSGKIMKNPIKKKLIRSE